MPYGPAMPRKRENPPSPDGWRRQGVLVPDGVWSAARTLAGQRGHGAMKVLTTMGMGVAVGMPGHVRSRLMDWIARTEWENGPEAITPEALWVEFLRAIREDLGNAELIGPAEAITPGVPLKPLPVPRGELPLPTPATHEVTRILDPAILKGKKKGGAA